VIGAQGDGEDKRYVNDNSPSDNLLVALKDGKIEQVSPNRDIIPFSGSATTLQSRSEPFNGICKVGP
jgi:hypothetical protein